MAEKESEKKPVAAKKAAEPKAEVKEIKATAKPKVASKPKAESVEKKTTKKPKAKTLGEVTVTLKKSGIGKAKDQKATIKGLGFKRLNQTVTLQDTPSVRGMINKISHLVEVQ